MNKTEWIKAAMDDADRGARSADRAATTEADPHQFTRLGLAAAYFRAAQAMLKNTLEYKEKP